MRESRSCTESTFDLFKRGEGLGEDFIRFVTFTVNREVVQLCCELSGAVEKVTIRIYEAEKRLNFANSCRREPVCEHSKFCGVRGDTSSGNYVLQVEDLLAEECALRGLEFEAICAYSF